MTMTTCKADATAADRVMKKAVKKVAAMTQEGVDPAVREYLLEVATVTDTLLRGEDDLLAVVAANLAARRTGTSTWYVVGEAS